jgi:hypothetical protein
MFEAVLGSGIHTLPMRTRPTLSPGELFRLLKAAFEARQTPECSGCRIPLPYAVERPDAVSANWRIGTPKECPQKCHALIAELALDLAARYDMSEYMRDEA